MVCPRHLTVLVLLVVASSGVLQYQEAQHAGEDAGESAEGRASAGAAHGAQHRHQPPTPGGWGGVGWAGRQAGRQAGSV